MGLPVYDFRHDLRNVLVTPQIRARFMRFAPGEVASLHSHDLGHEIFLVLQGRARFRIAGEEAELGPGQMCIALANQSHQVRVVGDEPMTLYLSVTPHIQPTHTGRTETDERLPLRYLPASAYDVEPGSDVTVAESIGRCVEASRDLAQAADDSRQAFAQAAGRLRQALAAGDVETAGAIRDGLWERVCRTYAQVYALGEVWNELAPMAGKTT
jgi:quercetin dioxygenase-like cupin family protein